MKAVVAHVLGTPETLAIEDWTCRSPASGEVRTGICYAGVSFVDVLTAAGGYQVKPPTPFIPGSDFSGIVLEVGAGVAGLAPGDRVCGGSFGGVFAEEIVTAATSVTRIAEDADMAEAAVLRSSYLTACYALWHTAKIQPGEVVLVLGAGGAVGIACVQLAKAYDAVVIASASSAAKRELALANGAAHAIDSNAADWRDQIKAITGGKGVNVTIDPIGGDHSERALRSLAWGGRHIVVGFAAGSIPKLPTNIILLKGGAVMGIDVRQLGIHEPAIFHAIASELDQLVATGVARPPIAAVLPLEQFAEAMVLAQSGTSAGRIVLKMPAADELQAAHPRGAS